MQHLKGGWWIYYTVCGDTLVERITEDTTGWSSAHSSVGTIEKKLETGKQLA